MPIDMNQPPRPPPSQRPASRRPASPRLVSRRLVVSGLSTALLAGPTALWPTSSAAARELTVADVYPLDHPSVQAVSHLSTRVAERTDGRHRIVFQPGQSAHSEGYLIGQVRNGTLDMARVDFASLASLAPTANVLALPYLFKSAAHRHRLLDSETGASILAQLEAQGLIGLCFYETGPRSFYGKKPIRHPADLKGLTIRAPQSGPWIRMMRTLGIRPLPMPYEHVYAALQQGTIDVAENNWEAFVGARHNEVAKYFSLTEHMRTPSVVIFSKRTWDTLSAKEQAGIRAAARESADHLRETMGDEQPTASTAPAGVEIVTDIDYEAFAAAALPLYQEAATTPQLQTLLKRIQAMEE